MTRLLRYFATGALLGQIACSVNIEDPKVVEDPKAVSARARAEALLSTVRQRDWGKAASFVLLDDDTRRQMGIPQNADSRTAQDQAGAWFERMYGTVIPGDVHDVEISTQDPNVARVSYFHEDLDGFRMRLVDGEWFYTLNNRDSVLQFGR